MLTQYSNPKNPKIAMGKIANGTKLNSVGEIEKCGFMTRGIKTMRVTSGIILVIVSELSMRPKNFRLIRFTATVKPTKTALNNRGEATNQWSKPTNTEIVLCKASTSTAAANVYPTIYKRPLK